MTPPNLERPLADWERLAKGLETSMALVRGSDEKLPRWHDLTIDYQCLRTLSSTLREAKWSVTVSVWQDQEVIAVQPGYHEDSYGAAVDIGSTTVALYLCNLRTGEMLAAESEMNPQIVYGEDVMSRIQYTIEHKDGLEKLHKAIISTLNKLLKQAAKTAKIKTEEILEMVLVGNSTMHHLLLNLQPKDLGLAPFVPAIHKSVDIKARELGLNINSSGNIHVLPTIASFVGADTSAMIVEEEPHKQDENWLLIDVGTNAELILGNRKRLLCTSTPTGPALEGAHVEYGMRAAPGAIERVHIDEQTLEPRYKIVGEEQWNKGNLRFRHHRRSGGIIPGGDRRFSGQVQDGIGVDAYSSGRKRLGICDCLGGGNLHWARHPHDPAGCETNSIGESCALHGGAHLVEAQWFAIS